MNHYNRRYNFSMPTCASTPITIIAPCPRNAPIVEVEGDIIALAYELKKFEIPYNWYKIPANPTAHVAAAGMCKNLRALVIETHRDSLFLLVDKYFPGKDPERLTAYSGPLMGTPNERRKYSVTSDAISNSCWHDTVTGSDFDLIAHGQVRIMPQGWEKLLRQCKGFVSKEVA